MQIYLAAAPPDLKKASECWKNLAYAAYRIGPDSTLLRETSLSASRGGLLLLSDAKAPPIRDGESLAQAVLRECRRRNAAGAVLDFEEPPSADRKNFAAILARRLSPLYVPQDYAVPGGIPLVQTAVSGGNLQEYLEAALRRYGTAALDVQRLCMDFPLPSPSGTGAPMPFSRLSVILRQTRPQTFFSGDLCARYFTCLQDGQTHFLLYDDGETLRKKLQLGRSLGFSAAFLMYPEVCDFPASFWQTV